MRQFSGHAPGCDGLQGERIVHGAGSWDEGEGLRTVQLELNFRDTELAAEMQKRPSVPLRQAEVERAVVPAAATPNACDA